MKTKQQKMVEYQEKYGMIPTDYIDRLNWLYDTLKIDDKKSEEILAARQRMIETTYYTTLKIIFYEIPEYTPRPRARIVHRSEIINSVTGGNDFIQVYSITGKQNQEIVSREYSRLSLSMHYVL